MRPFGKKYNVIRLFYHNKRFKSRKENDVDKNIEFSRKNEEKVMEKPLKIISFEAAKSDPNGSYTGKPINPYEKPVQDVDDL